MPHFVCVCVLIPLLQQSQIERNELQLREQCTVLLSDIQLAVALGCLFRPIPEHEGPSVAMGGATKGGEVLPGHRCCNQCGGTLVYHIRACDQHQ